MNDHPAILSWEFRHALRVTARGLIFAMVGLLAFAATSGSAEGIETKPAEQSLATCRLQILTGDNRQYGRTPPAEMSRRQRIAKPLADYHRARGIDWRVPKDVDPDDPHIRCLLMCPGGPFVVDLRVLIDGRPFRMKREELIDQAQADSKTTREQVDDLSEATAKAASDSDTKSTESKDQPTDDADVEEPTDAPDKTGSNSLPAAAQRLVRYLANQPEPVDRNEARWLMSQWTPGPVLLELRDGFAAERATIAPIWGILDGDRNGHLSTEEFSSAVERLINADSDADEVVEVSELRRFTGNNATATGASIAKAVARTTRRLLVTVGDHTDWNDLYVSVTELYATGGSLVADECEVSADLIERMDANDNQVWDADETSRLQEITPDLTLLVRLGKGDDSQLGLSVEQLSSAYGAADEILHTSEDSMMVELGRCHLELSAAQPGGSGSAALDQVAIGAVVDGYPIWRHLDRNNDRRLSLRECKSLRAYLDLQDKNQDGELTSHELALPMRVCVTLGPLVDQILRNPAPPVAIPTQEGENTTAPPWFALMDINKDGDLSRGEFLGTRDQFQRLDQDRDGLLSVEEVKQFDPGNE